MYLVCAVFGHAKTVKLLGSDGCPRCLKIIGEDGNYYDLFSPWSIHSPKAFARHQARMEEYWKPTAVTTCTDLTQETVKITLGGLMKITKPLLKVYYDCVPKWAFYITPSWHPATNKWFGIHMQIACWHWSIFWGDDLQ